MKGRECEKGRRSEKERVWRRGKCVCAALTEVHPGHHFTRETNPVGFTPCLGL